MTRPQRFRSLADLRVLIPPDALDASYGTPAPAPRAAGCRWPACRCDVEDTGCPHDDAPSPRPLPPAA